MAVASNPHQSLDYLNGADYVVPDLRGIGSLVERFTVYGWELWRVVEDGLNVPTIASEDWGSGYQV